MWLRLVHFLAKPTSPTEQYTFFIIFDCKNVVTLKSGSEVTQGH